MSNAEHLRVIEGEGRAPSTPPADPLIGRTVDGRYLIERVLGEGGMGLVYKAKHTVLGKPLAIKVLRPDVSKDEEIITRFRQEAQSATSIGNEHIIDISDFGTLPDGSTYFVMEFLEGSDLTKAIEKVGAMEPGRTVKIAKQLCRALGGAHERGIVHRYIMPDNIYLIKRGNVSDFVKVLDFGIAKVSHGGNTKLTRAGQVFGTPHYMSPEQCAGTNVDHRTDIYAIGVILYEMACGRVPFDADNLMGILTKHLYEEPIPPHELPPPVDVPPPLEAIILKCLAKTPDHRYQNMGEMAADLEKLEQGLTPDAVLQKLERSSSAVGREPTGRTKTGMNMSVGEPEEGLPKKRSMLLPIAGVGGVLAILGIVAVIAFTQKADPVQQPIAPIATPPPVAVQTPPPVVETPPPAPTETGSTTSRKIAVNSNPTGAEVFLDGVLLGNTPIDVDRPEGTVQYEIRLPGYVTRVVPLAAASGAQFTVNLQAEPVAVPTVAATAETGHRRIRRTNTNTPAEGTPTPVTMETPTTMTTMSQASEVLNPWGD